jgi:hypothetical protein
LSPSSSFLIIILSSSSRFSSPLRPKSNCSCDLWYRRWLRICSCP